MSDNSGDNKKDSGDPLFQFGGPNGPKLPNFKGFGNWKYLLIYISILLVGITLFNYVFLNRINPAIDFSEFKARINSGEIKRVELTDSYFTGFTNISRQSSSRINIGRPPYSTSQDKVYRTVSIYDPEFIKFLDGASEKVNHLSQP